MNSRITASLLIITILVISPLHLSGQPDAAARLPAFEDTLYYAFEELYAEGDDGQKKLKSDRIQQYFSSVLSLPASYYYPFDSLKRIGKVHSPDKKIRAITWNIPFSDGTHQYYGFIQHTEKKMSKQVYLYTLEDLSRNSSAPENEIFTPENWFGALYYDIRQTKHAGKAYYTLMGFDFNDLYSTKKVLDVLTIDAERKVHFGAPVFETESGQLQHRIIFEYSAQAVMALRYDPDIKMIVFDHLSPIEDGLEGVYKFYGPDFSYDGYKFKGGRWRYHPDLDVRNR